MKRAGLFHRGKKSSTFPLGFVLFAIVLICFAAGCVSAGKAALLEQRDPIALVSVVSNVDIHWKDEAPINPKSSNLLSKKARRKNPDLAIAVTAEELIVSAESIFRNHIADSELINLADKEKVLSAAAYQDARINKYQADWEMVKPEDYRLVDFRDKNFFPAMASETGIQRFMFVDFYFTTAMASGVGKTGNGIAELEMRVLIVDSRGKTIYRKVIPGWSRSTVKVSNGAYPKTGMMGLFHAAIDDACFDFLDQLED